MWVPGYLLSIVELAIGSNTEKFVFVPLGRVAVVAVVMRCSYSALTFPFRYLRPEKHADFS